MSARRTFTVLVGVLLAVGLSGCSIQEPDSSIGFGQQEREQAEDGRGHGHGGEIGHIDAAKAGATRPTRSIRKLVDLYALLRTNIAADSDEDHLRALMAISTVSHAGDLSNEVRGAIEDSDRVGSSQGGEVIGISTEEAGDQVAVYAIVRYGRYDGNGALVGDTSIAVFSVGIRRTDDGRYLVDSWRAAK